MTLIIDFIAIFLWLNYLFYEESFDEYMGRAKRSGDHDPGINDRGYNKFMKRLYPYLKC